METKEQEVSTGKGLVVWLLLFTWAAFAILLARIFTVFIFEVNITWWADVSWGVVLAVVVTIITPKFISWIRT